MSAINKRKAPNGMYWCNVQIDSTRKCVMAECIDEENRIFRCWSNSSLVEYSKLWDKSEDKNGWWYQDLFEDEIIFFDY